MRRWNLWVCAAALAIPSLALAAGANGSGGDMPAYYDGRAFTINFKELTSGEAAVLQHNTGVNTIYMSDPGLPGGEMFVSVLDAIQGDGFNPLWKEVQITFTAGHTPQQLFSDTEIDSFATAGIITLSPTTEIYRCSVVGQKPKATTSSLAPSATAPAVKSGVNWSAIKALYRR